MKIITNIVADGIYNVYLCLMLEKWKQFWCKHTYGKVYQGYALYWRRCEKCGYIDYMDKVDMNKL